MRRYAPLKASTGTRIPPTLRVEVLQVDGGCVGRRLDMPGDCYGAIELDHIRASGAMGKKSETTRSNLASLCSIHHRVKTRHGREWRPRLLAYVTFRDVHCPAGKDEEAPE